MNVKIGLRENLREIKIEFFGEYFFKNLCITPSKYLFFMENEKILIKNLKNNEVKVLPCEKILTLKPKKEKYFFTLNVISGKGFHWEREISGNFKGNLIILKKESSFTIINEVDIEEYVKGVISSEMNPEAPLEYLKLHSVISRNFAYRIIKREKSGKSSNLKIEKNGDTYKILGWYGNEEHKDFDLCSDDHCQRYHGFPIDKPIYEKVTTAVEKTKGAILFYENKICDTRFSKCCGGLTEEFKTAWDDIDLKYLTSKSDLEKGKKFDDIKKLLNEKNFLCNLNIKKHRNFFRDFDKIREDFFRWEENIPLSLIHSNLKNYFDIKIGKIKNVEVTKRGKGLRAKEIFIEGNIKKVFIGKELIIRKILSDTHLLSSLFYIEGIEKNILRIKGGGWGHGVGLCQIGSITLVLKGFTFKEILKHYYPNSNLKIKKGWE